MFGNKSVWGWLYPYQGSKKCRALKSKSYVVGKDSGCDVVISKQQIPSTDDYANLNKQHFKIKRKDNEVILKDLSSMHTYVNGKELYFNEKVILKHNDVISVLRHHFKVFVFLDNKSLQADDYPEVIKNKYVISCSLSERKPTVTNMVFEKETCKRLVLKKINNVDVNKTAEEIDNIRKLQHPCLLSIHDVHVTAEEVYVVREHVEGGNLLSRIHPKKTLTDDDIKLIIYQTALAVQYLHDNHITHGSLKPENILLLSPDSKSLVKVTDISLTATNNNSENADADSPLYAAPEFASLRNNSRPHTFQADVWALGVILFYCLSGSPPFKQSVRTSSEWTCSFLPSVWSRRSLAKDLVKTMLVPDSTERVPVERILSHPWLKADSMRSLAHSLMYPGEKYEPPEEDTPPCSPKQLFFEDIIIQTSKPPRNLTEKFGVQVLPLGPVSRKSTPEHVFRKSEPQEEFQNHTFKKSSSFRQTANVDNTFFRKSWSQRLPGAKPVPPTKPPRQTSENRPQSIIHIPCDQDELSRQATTPPVPPAKPLRLFKRMPSVENTEGSNSSQDASISNRISNGDASLPPNSGDSSSMSVVSEVGLDTQATPISSDDCSLSHTTRVLEHLDVGSDICVPPPVPSPRYKAPLTPEYSELEYRNTQRNIGENNTARLEMREGTSSNAEERQSTQAGESDKIPSNGLTAQSGEGRTFIAGLPVPPQKPVRTSLLSLGTQPTSDIPRKKRLAPQPPPKPRKSQLPAD